MTDGSSGRTRAARAVTVDEAAGPTTPAGKTYRCQVHLYRRGEGFLAVAAALPGVAGVGGSEADALADITRAFRAAIPAYTQRGGRVPWLADAADPEPGGVVRWVFPEL